jgi:arginyl-tRNA synthetase
MNISSKESYIDQKLSVLKAGLENFLQGALAEVDFNHPVVEVSFERTKDSTFGDLTLNTAMKYAKFLKTNPLALAERLKTVVEELDNQTVDRVINKVEVKAPGFINIYLSNNFYEKVLNQALAGTETFGDNKLVEGEKWAVEHTSPNPNKAMHIGHLRNNLVGMSLSNLLKSCGATVTKEAIMNDRGIAIAKLMYGYLYGMLVEDSEAAKMAS